MIAQERYEVILQMLKESNVIRIQSIAEKLNVSNETARRDLETLQDQKLLKRVHGGAMLTDQVQNIPGTARSLPKVGISYAEKMAIGKLAASLVKSGETIFLDIGSTTLQVARFLKGTKNLTVLTTSLPIVNELANSSVNVIVLGGKLLQDDQMIFSPFTSEIFERYYVDKSFIGCAGITLSGGVTDYSENCLNRNVVREHSAKTILVTNSEKFGKNALVQVCPLSAIDIICSDENLKREYVDNCREQGIEVLLAPAGKRSAQ
ncbi:MAG: DeoR/GlpR transcriptional regulator [Spirochaetales bacterium]|nr:DeoR/GlpR transcriptional regulator [Spirochaetales bacterium]